MRSYVHLNNSAVTPVSEAESRPKGFREYASAPLLDFAIVILLVRTARCRARQLPFIVATPSPARRFNSAILQFRRSRLFGYFQFRAYAMPRGEHAAPLMGTRGSISDSLLESRASPSVRPVSFAASVAFAKSKRNAIRYRGRGSRKKKKKKTVFSSRASCMRDNYMSLLSAANRALCLRRRDFAQRSVPDGPRAFGVCSRWKKNIR